MYVPISNADEKVRGSTTTSLSNGSEYRPSSRRAVGGVAVGLNLSTAKYSTNFASPSEFRTRTNAIAVSLF
jgi:hypothetical protein